MQECSRQTALTASPFGLCLGHSVASLQATPILRLIHTKSLGLARCDVSGNLAHLATTLMGSFDSKTLHESDQDFTDSSSQSNFPHSSFYSEFFSQVLARQLVPISGQNGSSRKVCSHLNPQKL